METVCYLRSRLVSFMQSNYSITLSFTLSLPPLLTYIHPGVYFLFLSGVFFLFLRIKIQMKLPFSSNIHLPIPQLKEKVPFKYQIILLNQCDNCIQDVQGRSEKRNMKFQLSHICLCTSLLLIVITLHHLCAIKLN